jgi:hypothetical protein
MPGWLRVPEKRQTQRVAFPDASNLLSFISMVSIVRFWIAIKTLETLPVRAARNRCQRIPSLPAITPLSHFKVTGFSDRAQLRTNSREDDICCASLDFRIVSVHRLTSNRRLDSARRVNDLFHVAKFRENGVRWALHSRWI